MKDGGKMKDYEVTLATIRDWAERNAFPDDSGLTEHARGYMRACRDALKILDMHGRPAHETVVFGE